MLPRRLVCGHGFVGDLSAGERYVGVLLEVVGHLLVVCLCNDRCEGVIDSLDAFPGSSKGVATCINEASQVVGAATNAGGEEHAFLWSATTGMLDLGTLGGTYSIAAGLNNVGQVVGQAKDGSGASHAFLWQDGEMFDLNDLIPVDSGWDLLESGWEINDVGQIVGDGYIGDQVRGFLMTPSITVSLPDTAAEAGGSIAVPVRVVGFTHVGAVTLRIGYADTVLQYRGVASDVAAFTENESGEEIRIAWYDATGGDDLVDLGAGVLLSIEFDVIGDRGSSTSLDFTAECQLAGAIGEPISGTVFEDGSVRVRPSGAGAIVWANASEDSVMDGEFFDVEIWAENVTNLGSYRFSVAFDTCKVRFIRVRNGPFLGSTGRTTSETAIDSTNGVVTLGYSSDGPAPGPSGGGILGIIKFEAEVKDTCESTTDIFSLKAGLGRRQ